MQRFSLRNSKIRWIAGISTLGVITVLTFRYLILSWPIPVIFRDHLAIPEGASTYRVASLLKERGLIADENIFVNAVRLNFGTRAIRAGNFQLLNVRHAGDLVEQLLRPRLRSVAVTIPEGLTIDQVSRFIDAKYAIDLTRFKSLTEDSDFIRSLGLEASTLEGYLFPDSYQIYNGDTEEEIITLMVGLGRTVLNGELIEQGLALGLDTHGILTIASIIEGEARYDSERVIISAVYHNRLHRDMHLQADPTIQYAIPDGPRRLLYSDYEFPSEYNTYIHKGLPPGPINNPGLASIKAAVAPADVEYLYFVADGEGRHIFSNTLEQHNMIVRDLRQ